MDMPPDEIEEVIPNAADPAQVQEARRQSRKKKEHRGDFIKACLATPLGQEFFWELLSVKCHTFENRFACGPNGFPQPDVTWFQAGEKAIGTELYQELMFLDRDGVLAMHEQCDPRYAKPKRQKIED